MGRLKEMLERFRSYAGDDGMQEIAVSALIVVAFGWIRPVWVPVLIALALCGAKKVHDCVKNKGVITANSLACDCIGALTGLLLVLLNSIG